MINIVIFVSFWLGIWCIIWFIVNKMTDSSQPGGAALFAAFITFIIGFASSIITTNVLDSVRQDAENVRSVTEIQVQEVYLPNGKIMKIFVLSRGWSRDGQGAKVRLLSDVVPYTPTEDVKFY